MYLGLIGHCIYITVSLRAFGLVVYLHSHWFFTTSLVIHRAIQDMKTKTRGAETFRKSRTGLTILCSGTTRLPSFPRLMAAALFSGSHPISITFL
jgi:hypothetical protein